MTQLYNLSESWFMCYFGVVFTNPDVVARFWASFMWICWWFV